MSHDDLICYKSMPRWTVDTMPEAIRNQHNTKVGTWAKITIFSGQLQFDQLDEAGNVLGQLIFDSETETPFVEPQAWHKVTPLTDDLEMQLNFYCTLEDYISKKYDISRTHSEVIFAKDFLEPASKVLDLGSGSGRNSLYLTMLGHEVTSVDANGQALVNLENMAQAENLPSDVHWYDINEATIEEDYDFILSTVVFMFLNRDDIPAIIHNMQTHTKPGGYNLIVCAMDTPDYPCQMPFRFTFTEGELQSYYEGWEFLRYNEDVGELHKRDENGNRIKLRFATMLAKKPD
ncbi:SAM-dependent methyltransferase TehB [Streptococcus caprae]|uniref:SAM-dependent methyltransferase TehB n=1 Tax=Streptococcus caprae TaxID=1640501 RepID=A0ABV8CUN4_9STRE